MDFNPRPPRGGRRQGRTAAHWDVYIISIHAPREGGDREARAVPRACLLFQSTPPARGATELRQSMLQNLIISIHAPREGGDSKDAQFYLRIFDK